MALQVLHPQVLHPRVASSGFASIDKLKQCLVYSRSFVSSPSPMLQVQEVGDGNINFVYIVKGPKGALCLKQGLPFVRIAQDWPLTQVPCPSCT
jgi:5-methylthioribose kinase